MTEKKTKSEKSEKSETPPEDQKGGVYLLVADNTAEFEAALRRVAFLANRNKGHVAILYVIEDETYLHWNFIEKQIQSDKRAEAEKVLWDVAQKLYDMCEQMPAFYIKEGKTREELMNIISTDTTIRALVLGAAASSSNPLISYFTGKGLSDLKVPLVIVPESC
ncbi:MAG: universal stress protein [Pseudomonadota bacterium]